MLFRNGENLKSELITYLSGKNKVTIFSPYIKLATLEQLLEAPNLDCEQIIVRWEPNDFAHGSSDIEVYDLCKKYNIALFMNNRIHLKLFTENFKDAFLGSANISERGISGDNHIYNYETCAYVESIERSDRLYLQKILSESVLVTDELVSLIKSQLPVGPALSALPTFEFPAYHLACSDFLISKLPMIDSPELLWELTSGIKSPSTDEQENCLCHDLALFEVTWSVADKKLWVQKLSESFFNTPFIIAFLRHIDASKDSRGRSGLRFGAVRVWFSSNTTSVPAPRAFELTKNVQILYAWIEFLSKGKYTVSVPGARSQVIKKEN